MIQSIIPPNKLKHTLVAGKSVVGTMVVEIRQPSVMQLLANAGLDFVIIDNEHGPFNIETVADLSRAANYVGLTPIVRIPDISYPYVAQTLDSGAQGIMIPRIYEAQQVAQAVEMMKYPPLGRRGNALSRGYTNFRSGNVAEALEMVNRETFLIVQIETKEAIDRLDEILTVPGVDVALIGPNDLAIALGVPGEIDAPVVREAINKTISRCQAHGVYPGLHINKLELASYWAKQGMRLLSSSSETGLIIQGGRQMVTHIRAAWNETTGGE